MEVRGTVGSIIEAGLVSDLTRRVVHVSRVQSHMQLGNVGLGRVISRKCQASYGFREHPNGSNIITSLGGWIVLIEERDVTERGLPCPHIIKYV